ncbi:hypothetical protein [Epilithonimonas zeae]|uniref:hypothetical protein n=1 Tax=Epilithonimonas zeae TaxID=1416779 RepID=UPI00200DAE47|nr:hypothetical protein [Epilithonimonas zeae]UQB69139.1 hypothetical protein KI430_01475 [Epilithonimonas zeae]
MDELNELELILVDNLTIKYPSLKPHLPFLKVKERKLNKDSLIVNLIYSDFSGDFDDINALFSNGENIEIKGLKDGLSYVVDVSNGEITSIEFNTYNEKWDGIFGDYKIVKPE